MSIRLLISFKVQPGRALEYAAATTERRREALTEPGCEQFELFISQDDPDRIVQLERWTDEASLAVHAAAREKRGPLPSAALRLGEATMERYES